MRINGEYVVKGDRELVFALLQDPIFLAKAIPGAERLEQVGEHLYEATIRAGVGPVRGTFTGTVQISEQRPPEFYRLTLQGNGAAGFVRGTGTVTLVEVPEGTKILYEGETQIGGRIAQVGQRLVQSVARKMINDGLRTLEAEVQQRTGRSDTRSK
ncbi:MAG: carbon monoxide dehydrogenase subunit G [Ardenticatenia bacterium]|nr:carbon monoxide dehydrogenase subunit G [Ardenticatenia bacterium]